MSCLFNREKPEVTYMCPRRGVVTALSWACHVPPIDGAPLMPPLPVVLTGMS